MKDAIKHYMNKRASGKVIATKDANGFYVISEKKYKVDDEVEPPVVLLDVTKVICSFTTDELNNVIQEMKDELDIVKEFKTLL